MWVYTYVCVCIWVCACVGKYVFLCGRWHLNLVLKGRKGVHSSCSRQPLQRWEIGCMTNNAKARESELHCLDGSNLQ